ncbi:hypothetical protein T492DRAFT_904205 [Pavlovales sp. CCMP2436]|nr:hypothetical protein T492DRAFT_904205 [Pavlovales sp. CCMP2436]
MSADGEKSVGCDAIRADYTGCLGTWFREKFMKGEFIPNSDCKIAFEQLRDCMQLQFQQESEFVSKVARERQPPGPEPR